MSETITICMGSSCFARGNDRNLSLIENYLREHKLHVRIELAGARCEGECRKGPNIRFGDTLYHAVDVGMVLDLLRRHFPPGQ